MKGGCEGLLERFSDFVPDMALSFPFELDGFQKEVTELCHDGFVDSENSMENFYSWSMLGIFFSSDTVIYSGYIPP